MFISEQVISYCNETFFLGKIAWKENETNALRQHFSNYYKITQQTKINTYPDVNEIKRSISSVALLKTKTVEIIRSKLQHDFKHLLQKLQGQKEISDEEEELSE